MDKVWQKWTDDEDAILAVAWGEDRLRDKDIVVRLRSLGYERGVRAVKERRERLGLFRSRAQRVARPRNLNPAPQLCRERVLDQVGDDQRFKAAMLRAFNAGDEKVILGVVKDRRPWALKRIQAEPERSGCSSAVAWV